MLNKISYCYTRTTRYTACRNRPIDLQIWLVSIRLGWRHSDVFTTFNTCSYTVTRKEIVWKRLSSLVYVPFIIWLAPSLSVIGQNLQIKINCPKFIMVDFNKGATWLCWCLCLQHWEIYCLLYFCHEKLL